LIPNCSQKILIAPTWQVFYFQHIFDSESEEELKRLELGVVGTVGTFVRGCHDAGIARFCLLFAAGRTARSRFRYVRIVGMKEDLLDRSPWTCTAVCLNGDAILWPHSRRCGA